MRRGERRIREEQQQEEEEKQAVWEVQWDPLVARQRGVRQQQGHRKLVGRLLAPEL